MRNLQAVGWRQYYDLADNHRTGHSFAQNDPREESDTLMTPVNAFRECRAQAVFLSEAGTHYEMPFVGHAEIKRQFRN